MIERRVVAPSLGRSRMSRPLVFSACAICAFTPAAASAHHSRANYDMTKEIVVEGTVAELAWKNPHISMTLETRSPGGEQSRLEIELSSVSEALALGLKREAIEPGARVVVRAHPGRPGRESRGPRCQGQRRHGVSAQHRRPTCGHSRRSAL